MQRFVRRAVDNLMIRNFWISGLVLVGCFCPTYVTAQRPGETVLTIKRTDLKAGTRVITVLPPGEELLVKEVGKDFIRVSSVFTGWVRRSDVEKPQLAIAQFDLQISKKSAGADPYLGRAGASRFDLRQAIRDYDQAIRIDPTNAEAYAKRGECWAGRGQIDRALEDFAKALALTPFDPRSLAGRASVCLQRGKLDDALRDLEMVLLIAPEYAHAYVTRGFVHKHRREFDKAISDFDQAIQLRGYDPNFLMHRGDTWFASGRYDKAIDDYNLALRIFPNAICRHHRAKAWRAVGRIDRVIDDLEYVVLRNRADSAALNELAWYQATAADDSLRDGTKAVAHATKACELTDWKDAASLDTLAAAHAESGDFAHAVGFQKKALTLATEELKAEFSKRLDLYTKRKPFRETTISGQELRPKE